MFKSPIMTSHPRKAANVVALITSPCSKPKHSASQNKNTVFEPVFLYFGIHFSYHFMPMWHYIFWSSSLTRLGYHYRSCNTCVSKIHCSLTIFVIIYANLKHHAPKEARKIFLGEGTNLHNQNLHNRACAVMAAMQISFEQW